jgi:HEAT repeat protein
MKLLERLFGPDIRRLLETKQYDEIKKLALKDKRIVPKLIQQLESKHTHIVKRAAYLLGEMNEPRALPALERVVGRESTDDARIVATLERWKLPLPSSFPRYPVGRGTNEAAVAAAEKALWKITHADEELLIVALNDKNAEVREKIAEALGRRRSSKCAIEALIAVSNKDTNSHVRRKARLALVNSGKPAVEPLIVALKDKNPRHRMQTAWTLCWLQDRHKVERALEPLLAALDEKDMAVVAGAYSFFIWRGEAGTESILIKALEEYGHPEMVEHFINCGNSQLEEGGRRWASAHNFRIIPSRLGGGPKWGERREVY